MPGPPPQPINSRILRGNPGQTAVPARARARAAGRPEAPAFLVGYACDEWYRIAGGLHRLGLLTALDVMLLASYCVAYARWREAEELLPQMAARDPVTSGLLVKSQLGDARVNPIAKISRLAASDMLPKEAIRFKCNQHKVKGMQINYRSAEKYVGDDAFDLLVLFPAGTAWEVHYDVSVR
jgi:P27 family predicted phage terminase small subunit